MKRRTLRGYAAGGLVRAIGAGARAVSRKIYQRMTPDPIQRHLDDVYATSLKNKANDETLARHMKQSDDFDSSPHNMRNRTKKYRHGGMVYGRKGLRGHC